MHWKEVTHSNGSYVKKSRRQAWLTKWDKVKSHDTLIDWCIGREWPLNCMTVISAWWRSNMPFQRLSERLNYYIIRWRQEVRWVGDQRSQRQDVVGKATTQQKGPSGPPMSWRSDELVTRCGRESHHPAERALETSDWVGDQRSSWEDAGMRTCPREAGPPGLRLSSPGEWEWHTAMSGGAGEVNMLQSLFGLQLLLTHNLSNKVRGIFF